MSLPHRRNNSKVNNTQGSNTNGTKISRARHTTLMRLRHFVNARFWKGHSIHSPFVYSIVRHVLDEHNTPPSVRQKARLYRKALKHDDTEICVASMGAIVRKPRKRKVSNIAKNTSTSERYGLLLGRLASDMNAHTIVELGTSLGMSTAHMAIACPDAQILSLEGIEEIANVAKKHLANAGLANVSVRCCNIDSDLEVALNSLPQKSFDMAFVDANHSENATIQYFDTLINHAADKCLIVFDDIFWSKGMTNAWQHIVADDRIKTTIELPRMGLAFLRTGCQKEHYQVRW